MSDKPNTAKLRDELFLKEVSNVFLLSLQTEDLFNIFKDVFLSDFQKEGEYIKSKEEKPSEKTKTEETNIKEDKKEIPKKYLSLFRKIVKITHPDIDKENRYTNMHTIVSEAKEKEEWHVFILVANILGIEMPLLSLKEKNAVRKFGVMHLNRIKAMKDSHEWEWSNTPDHKKEETREKLYEKFDIDIELFNIWRSKNEK